MNNYVKYVVCKHTDNGKTYLFYAPFFSNITSGDEVLVDTQFGDKRATVLETCDVGIGSDVEKTLLMLSGANKKTIKRVIGKYNFAKFDYEDDENNG
jgi:hypothetical protein